MPLFGGYSQRPSSPIGKSSIRPGQVQKPVLKKPVAPPKPKGLFGGGSELEAWQLRARLKKTSPKIRGFSKKYTEKERKGFEQVLRKYGAGKSGRYYSKGFKTALEKMRKEKMYAKDFSRKEELKRQIRYLEDLEKGI